MTDAARIHRVRAEILRSWWESARVPRDALPWRQRRDPWQVLVAEVMLAQTQTSRVAIPYVRFVTRYPTPSACAVAEEADLIRAWRGLGYYRRALQLHRTARHLVERHGGVVPADLPSLLELPGVGPYVGRAVLSFAFDEAVGVVDANIGRVLARAIAGARLTSKQAASLADSLVPGESARDWNLTLMDFGSVVCRSRRPLCDACPLGAARLCAWRNAGGPDPAERSASVSRPQSRFEGSDRQIRGKLIAAACRGPVNRASLSAMAGADPVSRVRRLAEDLVDEGLLRRGPPGSFALPSDPSRSPNVCPPGQRASRRKTRAKNRPV